MFLGAIAIVLGIGYAVEHNFKITALRSLYQDNHECNVRGMFLSREQDDLLVCQRPGRGGAKVVILRSSLRGETSQ